jgi:hypothetical protein
MGWRERLDLREDLPSGGAFVYDDRAHYFLATFDFLHQAGEVFVWQRHH